MTELDPLLDQTLGILDQPLSTQAQRFKAAVERYRSDWTVLVSGLCSVGKSSFVGALWGDSEILPAAVRDCTQTNTLLRVPQPGEEQRRILLAYLDRAAALDFAARGLQYYRLSGMIRETLGPEGPRLEEMPPGERLRQAAASVRQLFQQRAELLVLHEPLTDEIEQLDEFLAFLESAQYKPGETVAAEWEQRREHLMGLRRPDGRPIGIGRLLALKHVEMACVSTRWTGKAPVLIDTPWVPAYHNARRSELIREQARNADLMIILALPQDFTPEEWVLRIFRDRPEMPKRTLVIFNQVDTVDPSMLFKRGGFAQAFEENSIRLAKLGIDPANIFLSCARLPFLENAPKDAFLTERLEKLRMILTRIGGLAAGRAESSFKKKLLAACDITDAGIGTLRSQLETMREGSIQKWRMTDLQRAFDDLDSLSIREDARDQYPDLRLQIRAHLRGPSPF